MYVVYTYTCIYRGMSRIYNSVYTCIYMMNTMCTCIIACARGALYIAQVHMHVYI